MPRGSQITNEDLVLLAGVKALFGEYADTSSRAWRIRANAVVDAYRSPDGAWEALRDSILELEEYLERAK
jgi:tryptophan 2,3-dioxygenase